MTSPTHAGLPVAGYKPQSADKVALVNEMKQAEEVVLRMLDDLASLTADDTVNGRWLQIGRTSIEQGFMAANRAIFQPGRVTLAEDA